ncbi:MAG: hypothetical protein HY738_13125, partial [Bacteroidia bacterium]|nr:hypothetical protein [Bacteroidia bacterium]
MKKVILLVLILGLLSLIIKVIAIEKIPVRTEIISAEYGIINGTFDFSVKYVFTDTITFGQNTEFDLPDGWTANINPVLTSNTYNAGDSIFATITVNY